MNYELAEKVALIPTPIRYLLRAAVVFSNRTAKKIDFGPIERTATGKVQKFTLREQL